MGAIHVLVLIVGSNECDCWKLNLRSCSVVGEGFN